MMHTIRARAVLSSLKPRERRAVIGGGVVVVVLLSYRYAVPAWREWTADAKHAAIESTTTRAETEASIARIRWLRDSVRARAALLQNASSAMLPGSTAAASGAALTSVLADAARLAMVQLGAIDVRPDTSNETSTGMLIRISARTDATGDVRGLTRFLALLEGGAVRVVVRELTVTQSEPGGSAERVERLQATLAVEALAASRRKAAPKPEPR